jgi:predicted histidine transporter YuiF (NhaC family)
MSFTTDPNVLMIYALIFLLGLLIGVFLTAGGRRKWRERYNSENERRRELERNHAEREKYWADQEKDWRERDSLRAAAIKDPREPGDGEVRSL